MEKFFEYVPVGVCSSKINITIDNNVISKVEFVGGCPGNTEAVSRLCVGRNVDDVINRLKGINCSMRGTSCPDQLAKALEELKNN